MQRDPTTIPGSTRCPIIILFIKKYELGTVEAELPIRREAMPMVDIGKLLPHYGNTQYLLLRDNVVSQTRHRRLPEGTIQPV